MADAGRSRILVADDGSRIATEPIGAEHLLLISTRGASIRQRLRSAKEGVEPSRELPHWNLNRGIVS